MAVREAGPGRAAGLVRPGGAGRVRLLGLFLGGRRGLVLLGGLLELLDRLAEAPGELGQLRPAEKKQDDEEDQHPLTATRGNQPGQLDIEGFHVSQSRPDSGLSKCVSGTYERSGRREAATLSRFWALSICSASKKPCSWRMRVGWRILRSAFASIWRMRSRVTLNCLPTSSSVRL